MKNILRAFTTSFSNTIQTPDRILLLSLLFMIILPISLLIIQIEVLGVFLFIGIIIPIVILYVLRFIPFITTTQIDEIDKQTIMNFEFSKESVDIFKLYILKSTIFFGVLLLYVISIIILIVLAMEEMGTINYDHIKLVDNMQSELFLLTIGFISLYCTVVMILQHTTFSVYNSSNVSLSFKHSFNIVSQNLLSALLIFLIQIVIYFPLILILITIPMTNVINSNGILITTVVSLICILFLSIIVLWYVDFKEQTYYKLTN